MTSVITFIQMLLLFGGLAAIALPTINDILRWPIVALCVIGIIFLQDFKVKHMNPALKTAANNNLGKKQTIVAAIGIVGFWLFVTMDALGHIDTSGVSGRDMLIAAVVAGVFIVGGMWFFRRRPS